MSHNPMGLHGLLQRQFYLYKCHYHFSESNTIMNFSLGLIRSRGTEIYVDAVYLQADLWNCVRKLDHMQTFPYIARFQNEDDTI
jgi:hypothetical protein